MPAANCGPGRGHGREVRGGQSGPEAFFGGRGGSADARAVQDHGGHAQGGRDVPRHQLRAAAGSGSPVPALHRADGADARLHVLPARRHDAHRRARSTPRRPPIRRAGARSSSARRRRRPRKPRARGASSTNLATYAYRRPSTPADVDALMEFYRFGRKEKDFDQGVEMALARVLASPQFIYRIEEEPAVGASGASRTASADVDLASRLSFFLWSTAPDDELLRVAAPGAAAESCRARAAGAADAEGSQGRTRWPRTSRASG